MQRFEHARDIEARIGGGDRFSAAESELDVREIGELQVLRVLDFIHFQREHRAFGPTERHDTGEIRPSTAEFDDPAAIERQGAGQHVAFGTGVRDDVE